MPKKAISIRFDEEKFKLAKKETGQPTVQKLVNYVLDSIWYRHHPKSDIYKSKDEVIQPEEEEPKKVNTKDELIKSITDVAPKGLNEKSNQSKILELEVELKSLGNSSVAVMRKKFLQKQIQILKK